MEKLLDIHLPVLSINVFYKECTKDQNYWGKCFSTFVLINIDLCRIPLWMSGVL